MECSVTCLHPVHADTCFRFVNFTFDCKALFIRVAEYKCHVVFTDSETGGPSATDQTQTQRKTKSGIDFLLHPCDCVDPYGPECTPFIEMLFYPHGVDLSMILIHQPVVRPSGYSFVYPTEHIQVISI